MSRLLSRSIPAGTLLLDVLLFLLSFASPIVAADFPVAPANCSALAGTCIRIGYFVCNDPAICTGVVGLNEQTRWYQQRIEQQFGGRLGGVPVYWVEAVLQGYFVSTTAKVNETISQLFIGPDALAGRGPPLVDFVSLPMGSKWDTAMVLLEQHRIPSVAGLTPDSKFFQCGATEAIWRTQVGCRGPNTRRFNYAHGLLTAGEAYYSNWLGLLKLQKAKTIATIRTSQPFYFGVWEGAVAAAADNEIALIYSKAMTVVNADAATIAETLAELQALPEPDGLLLLVPNCVPWLNAFAEADYSPRSIATILCTDGQMALSGLGDRMKYITGSSQWDPRLKGIDYTENADVQPYALFPHVKNGRRSGLSSPQQFAQFHRNLMNSTLEPGYSDASVLLGFSMLEGALWLANTTTPQRVQAELRMYYQPSFYGLLTTDRYGQNRQKPVVINQRDENNELQLIAPANTATADFIYPMPRWSERTYTRKMYATTIEKVVMALMTLCALMTAGLVAYLLVNRKQQTFQAAGLPWYLLQALGCMVAYLSVLGWGVENSPNLCAMRFWMWTAAFHLFIAPMLSSSWRICTIVSQGLRTKRVTNWQVGLVSAAIYAPQLLINILWSTIAPLRIQVVTSDPLRPAHTSFTKCTTNDVGIIFLSLTMLYSAALLIAACYFAYSLRRAVSLFNDARPIAVAVYSFTSITALVAVVQTALDHDHISEQRVLFGLRSIGLLIAYQGSIAVLYMRRIIDSRVSNPKRQYEPRNVASIGMAQIGKRAFPAPDDESDPTRKSMMPQVNRTLQSNAVYVATSQDTSAQHEVSHSDSIHVTQLRKYSSGRLQPLPSHDAMMQMPVEECVELLADYARQMRNRFINQQPNEVENRSPHTPEGSMLTGSGEDV